MENISGKLFSEEFMELAAEKASEMATPEEAALYCKVYESSPEVVLSQLGETREDILKMFTQTWMMRYVLENDKEL